MRTTTAACTPSRFGGGVRRRIFLAGTIALGCAFSAAAATPPIPTSERIALLARFREQSAVLDRAIAAAPREERFYSQRGDCRLFLGDYPGAISDFEKMIVLNPAQDAPHWRLGIAYYFAGQFAKSAKQFEKYHAHDGRDRENGIWKFLGDAKVLGRDRAQRVMLGYTRFDREPFPTLYEMFAGAKTTDEFLADLKTRELTEDPRVMFFANYYAGLNEEIAGHRERSLSLLHAAVAIGWKQAAGDEPTYMWQVARLHYEMLSGEKF